MIGQNTNVTHGASGSSRHAGLEKRYCRVRMKRRMKASNKRKQQLWVVSWVRLLSRVSLVLLVVSWKTGLLGERVGEANVLGPANFGGSNFPTKHTINAFNAKRGCPQTQRCSDNASVFIKISEWRLILSAPSRTNRILTNCFGTRVPERQWS